MSNIDKQAVQAVADLKAGYTLGHADVAILNELARIALASLEAEPIYQLWDEGYYDTEKGAYDAVLMAGGRGRIIYTAPPAPVAVMDEAQSRELFEKNCMANTERNKWHPELYAHIPAREQWAVWEACRNAMLRGADGNSPVIPDGWVAVPKEPTPDMREAYHQAQAEYEDSDGLWSPDHQWQAMLAAAPQQEV